MSRKLREIPNIPNYDWIRQQMQEDLKYRLQDRQRRTSLGRPLYERINVQVILTQECPNHCPFCIERQNPMTGQNDFVAQIEALEQVLAEHPNARLSITGGEPGLYPKQVKALADCYRNHSNHTFLNINTTGYDATIRNYGHINLSVNPYVQSDLSKFPDATYQTVLSDNEMTIEQLLRIMDEQKQKFCQFSFRFYSHCRKHEYPVFIFQQLKNHPDIKVNTFRVGDFFTYVTFNYHNCHARITLGDMWQQKQNEYQDGYSNIIIHPDGTIRTNWK